MNKNIFILTGFFGLLIVIITLSEFPMYMAAGAAPLFSDEVNFTKFVEDSYQFFLLRIFLDIFLCVFYITFLAGLRQIFIKAKSELEWIATLLFGAGVALSTLTLVADSMQAGVALSVVENNSNPSVIRALTQGYLLLYGSVGCSLIALISFTTGFLIIKSRAIPKWSGWIALIVGLLNVSMIPSLFGGNSPRNFYSAAGWGVAVVATFPWVIWIGIASILLLSKGFFPSKLDNKI